MAESLSAKATSGVSGGKQTVFSNYVLEQQKLEESQLLASNIDQAGNK